jgi:molecular chaperone GrpE
LASEREWDVSDGGNEREPVSGSPESAGVDPLAGESDAPSSESARPEPAAAAEGDVGGVPEDKGSETPDQSPEPENVQKRFKRSKRKELLDLIERKNAMLMELDRQLKNAKQDIAKKEDRLLRLAAEFENYKKRTRGEQELLRKTASADLIREIIWGIDNFDRAFANLGGAEDHIQEGIRLIHAGLMDILTKAGLKEIEAQGQNFDARYHEAVGEIESDVEEGRVAQVMQRGYMLHDQVLRPARVLVSKKRE